MDHAGNGGDIPLDSATQAEHVLFDSHTDTGQRSACVRDAADCRTPPMLTQEQSLPAIKKKTPCGSRRCWRHLRASCARHLCRTAQIELMYNRMKRNALVSLPIFYERLTEFSRAFIPGHALEDQDGEKEQEEGNAVNT